MKEIEDSACEDNMLAIALPFIAVAKQLILRYHLSQFPAPQFTNSVKSNGQFYHAHLRREGVHCDLVRPILP